MNFEQLFKFLEDLSANNHKDWMDTNRKNYHEVKAFFKDWLTQLSYKLKEVNPDFSGNPDNPKIFRINRNKRFNPNLPTYKDNFSSEIDSGGATSFFYLQFGVNESFIAGGYYQPEKEALQKVRQAIDYDGERLKAIVQQPSFVRLFGEFDDDEKLKRPPKGFSKDHPHLDLLRFKNFIAAFYPTRQICNQANFMNKVVEVYQEMMPFRAYLDQAIQFEA